MVLRSLEEFRERQVFTRFTLVGYEVVYGDEKDTDIVRLKTKEVERKKSIKIW